MNFVSINLLIGKKSHHRQRHNLDLTFASCIETYVELYFSVKWLEESRELSARSSVVFVLLNVPPRRTVPPGEAQLVWDSRLRWRLWESVQLPPLNLTQVVSALWPPHASSPVWVWACRICGKSGREHQGVPSSCRSSTDVPPTQPPMSLSNSALSPPVTIIAENNDIEFKILKIADKNM